MIRAEIVGSDKIVANFAKIMPTLMTELERATARSALKLLRHVKEEKLSDQVLHVRSGRLRRSISMRVETSGLEVSGAVGTNVAYAHRLEFGAHGTETVRAFMRRAPGSKKNAARSIPVRSFTRKQNTKEYRFLRDSYDELREPIQAELASACTVTVRELFGGHA